MKNSPFFSVLFLLTALAFQASAQVGIGTATPNPKSVLELKSPTNNQGFLVPRLTTAQRNAISGLTATENGLMVYDSDEQKFYYWQNTQWQALRSGADSPLVAGAGVTITGNTISVTPDGDGSATNEIQDLQLTGSTLKMSNNPSATAIDLAVVSNIDNQSLAYDETSGQLTISEGNNVTVKPADNGVTSAKILDGAVNTIDLADGAVTNIKLGDNSVTSAKIVDGTIVDADVSSTANLNVTKLAKGSNGEVLTTTAAGIVWQAVSGAAGGTVTSVATGTGLTGGPISGIGTISIADGGVGTAQIADNAITSVKIANGTIVNGDVADGAITSAKISDGTVAAGDLNAMGAANGQILKYNGTAWAPAADNSGISTALTSGNILVGNATNVATAVAVSGDATVSNTGALTIGTGAITSAKILDGTIASGDILDGAIAAGDLNAMGAANGQVLKYNGTAWAPGTDAGISSTLTSANILVGNATNVATAVAMSGDAAISNTGALTIGTGAITSAKIADGTIATGDVADGAIDSLKITDNSVASGDILDGTISAGDLNAMGAAGGQVLKYNGSAWAPAADNSGISTVLSSGNILVGNASNVATGITMTGDVAITNAGVTTIGTGAITSGKILDGTVAAGDLNAMGAAGGQVLKYTGSAWAPAADNAGISTVLSSGNILVGDATNVAAAVTMTGDAAITNAGVITIGTGAITSTKILDGTIAAGDLNAMGAAGGQVLKYNGSAWAPAADNSGISTVLNSGNILVGNATNVATAITMTGDAAISNAGVITIGTGAITSAKIADGTIANGDVADGAINSIKITDNAIASGDILDGTVAAVDLNAMGAANGQVLKYNGTAWAPAADVGISSTLTSGNILVGNPTNVATAVTMTGDATISNAGVITIGTGAVTSAKIADGTIANGDVADGAINSIKITDNSIAAADLNAMGATNGQVLKYNGTAWAPAADAGIPSALASGNILVGNATNVATSVAMSGDATISNTGALTIGTGAITTGKILDATITGTDLANLTVPSGKMTATGVTAGTYGSSTLIPQITVDAAGRITGATNVAASGGGSTPDLSEVLAVGGDAKNQPAVNFSSISINTAATPGALNVNGSQYVSFTPISDNYDVKPEDYLLIAEPDKPTNVTLPKASDNRGRILIIRATGKTFETRTIVGSTELIDGENTSEALYYYYDTSFQVGAPYSITVISTGTTWLTINRAQTPVPSIK